MRTILTALAAVVFAFTLGYPAYAADKVCDAPEPDGFFSVEQFAQKEQGPGFGSFEGTTNVTWHRNEWTISSMKSGGRDEAGYFVRKTYTSSVCLKLRFKRKGNKFVFAMSAPPYEVAEKRETVWLWESREYDVVDLTNWPFTWRNGFFARFSFNLQKDGYDLYWRETDGRTGEGFLPRVAPKFNGQVSKVSTP